MCLAARIWLVLVSLAAAAVGGEVQLCSQLGPDDSAQSPTTRFPAGTRHLYAVFKLDDNEHFRMLTATWIAVDAEKIPDNTELATGEIRLGRSRRGVFELEQPEPLTRGKYRLEVKADGNDWKTIEFTVGR